MWRAQGRGRSSGRWSRAWRRECCAGGAQTAVPVLLEAVEAVEGGGFVALRQRRIVEDGVFEVGDFAFIEFANRIKNDMIFHHFLPRVSAVDVIKAGIILRRII